MLFFTYVLLGRMLELNRVERLGGESYSYIKTYFGFLRSAGDFYNNQKLIAGSAQSTISQILWSGLESEPSWFAPILCEKEDAKSIPEGEETMSLPTDNGCALPKKKRTADESGIQLPPCSPIKKVRNEDNVTSDAPVEINNTP